jgi:hypothetical protein
MANFIHKKTVMFLVAVMVCEIVIAFCVPLTVLAQGDDLLRTAALEKRLKKTFRLTPRDTTLLHPLIKLENENVVLAYERYSNDESAEFLSLWESIRNSRRNFQASFGHGLTSRQKEALGFARTEFESQILDLWVDDYISILAEILSLDRLQASSVSNIFGTEREKRHRLIITEAKKHIYMNAEWQKLTDERERELKIILDAEQIREYRSLSQPIEELVAVVSCPAFRSTILRTFMINRKHYSI